MGNWLTDLWNAVKKVANTPAMVQASPGVATSYSTTGQYMPRVKSTVGNEAGYLLDVVTAPTQPSDIKAAYQIVRHPVQSARAAKKTIGEGVNYVKKKLAKKSSSNAMLGPGMDTPFAYKIENLSDAFKRLEFNTLMQTGKTPDYSGSYSLLSSSTRTPLPIPQKTKELLETTVYPRMALTRPNFTLDEFRELAYNKGFRIVPEDEAKIVMDHTKGSGKILGQSWDSGEIAIREGKVDFGLPHEVRHRIDYGRILSNDESKYLSKAYNNDFIQANSIVDGKPYNPAQDRVTTNLDARNKLFKELGINITKLSVGEQNNIISNTPEYKILDAVYNANGYGRNYINSIKDKYDLNDIYINPYGEIPKGIEQLADNIKEAMKYVGVGTGVATVANKQKYGGRLIPKRKKG